MQVIKDLNRFNHKKKAEFFHKFLDIYFFRSLIMNTNVSVVRKEQQQQRLSISWDLPASPGWQPSQSAGIKGFIHLHYVNEHSEQVLVVCCVMEGNIASVLGWRKYTSCVSWEDRTHQLFCLSLESLTWKSHFHLPREGASPPQVTRKLTLLQQATSLAVFLRKSSLAFKFLLNDIITILSNTHILLQLFSHLFFSILSLP